MQIWCDWENSDLTQNGQIIFKRYSMEQMSLLPPGLEELIPEGHLVRVVNRMVDELDMGVLAGKVHRGRDQQ